LERLAVDMLRLVKDKLAILSALAVLFVAGCNSSGEATATSAKATTGNSAAAKTVPADGDAAKLVGKWSDSKMSTCTFDADGKFTMSGEDTEMTGSFIGTYKLGGDSPVLKGGRALNVTVTDSDMKTKDPSKQADLDKAKPDLIKAVGSMFRDGSVKFDSDSEIEFMSGNDVEPHKMKKQP